jgi:hypothetical protein
MHDLLLVDDAIKLARNEKNLWSPSFLQADFV